MAWNLEDLQDNFILNVWKIVIIVIIKVVKLGKCLELFGGQPKTLRNIAISTKIYLNQETFNLLSDLGFSISLLSRLYFSIKNNCLYIEMIAFTPLLMTVTCTKCYPL